MGCLFAVERYEPSTNVWSEVPRLSKGRDEFVLFALLGKLFTVGGESVTELGSNEVECFDPILSSWGPGVPLIVGRSKHAGCILTETVPLFDTLIKAANTVVQTGQKKRKTKRS